MHSEGLDKAAIPMDVQLWYETIGSPSDVCPKGNILVVTARCQPTKKTFEVSFEVSKTGLLTGIKNRTCIRIKSKIFASLTALTISRYSVSVPIYASFLP